MKTSKVSKRSGRPTKSGAKKMTVHSSRGHVNTGHIYTYGRWVFEMSRPIREGKGTA
jgi:hypothetical protein